MSDWIWVSSFALCLLSSPGIADDSSAQLDRVRAKLQKLQSELNATQVRRDNVREDVSAIERRIGTLTAELRDTGNRLGLEERRLQPLQAAAGTARRDLDAQRASLAREARAQYMAGRQEHLKLLLNQENPAVAARVLTYYRYFHRARMERIEGIQRALSELAATEQRVGAKQKELRTLRETQQTRKQELETGRKRRGVLLASLDRRVVVQSQEIERLREDETRLTRLLTEIRQAFTDIPLPNKTKAAFGSLKGKLTAPARGRLVARYGEPKRVGSLKWRGVFIGAEEGGAVRAVARGRVAYADWLRGFGLLLIMEHGDGYMTLYGHNQSLHKHVGEWVEAGDTIGRIGTTGDAPQPGLYFEVRHHGEPRDPLLWVRVR